MKTPDDCKRKTTLRPAWDPARPLLGQTAVVTGSSSGIGRAVALAFARSGASVLVHARKSAEPLAKVASQIQQLGLETKAVLADFTHVAEQDDFVETAFEWRESIDIWVNNAGADLLTGDATEWSFDQKLQTLLEVDVASTVRISREVGKRMKENGQGAMINIGWDQAEFGMAGDSGELYAMAKGAIMSFTRSLALSLAPEVRVNCIAPGWIKTAWGETTSEVWQDRAKRESMLGRWGLPEEVANAACFLVSPQASFVNGQILRLNGGFNPAGINGQMASQPVTNGKP
ncbi:Short-chain dehydrogenase [Planctomycetales bacterium 10988]|nr:Short-chain dehydrogenase [Planctomycetales bacterium 10988]